MPQPLSVNSYKKLVLDIAGIYEKAKQHSLLAVNKITLQAYRDIGKRIVEVEQKNQLRAEYGSELLERLSEDLTQKYKGEGFSPTNLRYMRQFYLAYQIHHTRDELSWSHYRALLTIKDDQTRRMYEKKATKLGWSTRQLIQEIRKENIEQLTFENEPEKIQRVEEKYQQLRVVRAELYTYALVALQYVHPVTSRVLVDCGFSLFRNMPLEGLNNPKAGDIVSSTKTNEEYRFTPSAAKKAELYTYKAFVERIVDADTLWMNIDLGFDNWLRQKLRLRGIDAPEILTQKGQKAKRFVETALKETPFVIIKTHGSDKYDRYLADVFYRKGKNDPQAVLKEGKFLNQELLDLGLAKAVVE